MTGEGVQAESLIGEDLGGDAIKGGFRYLTTPGLVHLQKDRVHGALHVV